MNSQRAAAIQFAHENRAQFLDELKEFLSIPSISTAPEFKKGILQAAEWVSSHLKSIKLENVQIFQTAGHPIVYGEYLHAGPTAPTVLLYGHYDVQPPAPLELWETPPFEPTIREENIFARGASDMKGQVIASLKAVESILRQGKFPINIKYLVEGEEEIGSPNIAEFLKNNKSLLACDVALNLDSGMIDPEIPTITYSLRGLAFFEIRVYGPKSDLHSGVFGGLVRNPANALCKIIAGMHDENGRITLPGFYDRVRPYDADERLELARLPIDDAYYLQQTGAHELWGEKGFTPVERAGGRPTLDVNGIFSGYTGTGSKTIIPGQAMAKISTRIVPDQKPDEIHQQLIQYMEKNAPNSIRWEVIYMGGGPACYTDRNTPYTRALFKAFEAVWKKTPVFKQEGGSIPIVVEMQQILGVDSVVSGFGLPDDNIHAPNEKLNLSTWFSGIDSIIHFFYNLQTETK
jgi:acetylornithine deacetylase/succinyl-diaminopimelate desuccinylase-like protein